MTVANFGVGILACEIVSVGSFCLVKRMHQISVLPEMVYGNSRFHEVLLARHSKSSHDAADDLHNLITLHEEGSSSKPIYRRCWQN